MESMELKMMNKNKKTMIPIIIYIEEQLKKISLKEELVF